MRKFTTNENFQNMYDYCRANHELLINGQNSIANSYTKGYNAPYRPWPKTWQSYPAWAAGVDNRRECVT